MATNCYLDVDEKGKFVDQTIYRSMIGSLLQTIFRSMIGSLLYLIARTHDIMHNVCVCARFQHAHQKSHLYVVKRILKYLKWTKNLGL